MNFNWLVKSFVEPVVNFDQIRGIKIFTFSPIPNEHRSLSTFDCSPNDKVVPVSYYVLKVEARTCHMVVHVGFIGDKCFSRQLEVSEDWKDGNFSS